METADFQTGNLKKRCSSGRTQVPLIPSNGTGIKVIHKVVPATTP